MRYRWSRAHRFCGSLWLARWCSSSCMSIRDCRLGHGLAGARQRPKFRTQLSVKLRTRCSFRVVSYATGVSGPSAPHSDVTTVAAGRYAPPSVGPVGVGGWPVNIPSPVGPSGTAGWVMGLPEQARGTAQATVTGRVRTIPRKAPNIQYPIILAYSDTNTQYQYRY